MTKPIIAIDVDDVLTAGVDSFRKEINRQTGSSLTLGDYLVPDGGYTGYFARVWERHGITDRIDLDALNAQMVSGQTHVAPAAGALDVLTELIDRFDLMVVTDRPVEWKAATFRWIDEHYPGLFRKILFRRETDDSKGEVCAREGAGWLVDDNMAHAQTALDAGVPVILFGEYGWHEQVPRDITRCKDWPAVKEYFNAIRS